MGKIAPVATKYIIKAQLDANGVIEKPDVVGAIFGQTEGLLGSDLELRELQKSGRIGRIEVNVTSKGGHTSGVIEIPCSMDKAETAIIAASLETIDRVGPCTAKITTGMIEDVRISKRKYVIDRAKELLAKLVGETLPESQEITEAVWEGVRTGEAIEYGPEKLVAGPDILEDDELIIVEGRADVLNLLKSGIKNCIAIGGTSVPKTLAELTKKKNATLFVDGDRGGELIFKELSQVAELDFIARAPAGKEVEELSSKELHKSLRAKVAIEQVEKLSDVPVTVGEAEEDHEEGGEEASEAGAAREAATQNQPRPQQSQSSYTPSAAQSDSSRRPPFGQGMFQHVYRGAQPVELSESQKGSFKKYVDEIVGSRGAYLINGSMEIMGKVPISELQRSIEGVEGNVETVIIDGVITPNLLNMLAGKNVKYVVGMNKIGIGRVPQGINVILAQELK